MIVLMKYKNKQDLFERYLILIFNYQQVGCPNYKKFNKIIKIYKKSLELV